MDDEAAPFPDASLPPRFDPDAAAFSDLTLAFDAFFRWGERGVTRLRGRRFLRCNLAGPALVAFGGTGNAFADCVFSGCTFVVAPDGAPMEGAIRLEDCAFDDCVLTRWVCFLPPPVAAAMMRDMPHARFLGLPAAF